MASWIPLLAPLLVELLHLPGLYRVGDVDVESGMAISKIEPVNRTPQYKGLQGISLFTTPLQ